jgi:hypothetical protein
MKVSLDEIKCCNARCPMTLRSWRAILDGGKDIDQPFNQTPSEHALDAGTMSGQKNGPVWVTVSRVCHGVGLAR